MASLGSDEHLITVSCKIFLEDFAEIALRAAWGWPVVVSQIKVAYSMLKSIYYHVARRVVVVHVTEIVPES